jgi:hypothetical protein
LGGGAETGFGSGDAAGTLAAEGRGPVGGAAVGAVDAVGAAAGGAAAAAGAGGGATAAGAVLGAMALTAVWQGAESCAMCCFRQASASAPPRGTPEQFAMKSDRQDARIALIWSGLGCCARLGAAHATKAAAKAAAG